MPPDTQRSLRQPSTSRTAVWKFPLSIGPAVAWQEIEMPRYAGIVRVGQQDNVPTLWAVVSPDAETEKRRIIAIPTGFELSGHHLYIGSTEVEDGQIVVHVFEELPTIPDPAPRASVCPDCGWSDSDGGCNCG